jgi:hypothetical protein
LRTSTGRFFFALFGIIWLDAPNNDIGSTQTSDLFDRQLFGSLSDSEHCDDRRDTENGSQDREKTPQFVLLEIPESEDENRE